MILFSYKKGWGAQSLYGYLHLEDSKMQDLADS